VIETVADPGGERLTVIPHLVYGAPPIAEIRGNHVEHLSTREVPIRDPLEEARLSRELIADLHLKLNEAKVFSGEGAIRFVERMDGWDTYGGGDSVFTPASSLVPSVELANGSLDVHFMTPNGAAKASMEQVLKSWRSGGSFVPLVGGGWGRIPAQWLREHADTINRLLAARGDKEGLPARLLPDVAEVCESIGVPVPEYFARLKAALSDISTIPDAKLPGDLTAELRPYQRIGVNWLAFSREHGFGALLADDMGLGKTLQAMCIVNRRSLVVVPTSVLYSWQDQLRRFRPGLSFCIYHGPNRKLDSHADVVLTTYALLRLDIDALEAVEWDTIVLDEAQTIRNPDSQVARAAHRLKGRFKVTLSGTPVENSLQDLWSQFHFINPGLLGTRSEFEERFAERIEDGDVEAGLALRKRVQPFILRRMKRDVAKDLPPKTEVVLECELSEQERLLYESILGASRQEIVDRMAGGESVFSVLEALLRLRQACCHAALLPGQSADTSSKVELLLESLESSLAQGHRALVFSQWTSLLDLIEPHLRDRSMTFSRIDGSTTNRAGIVEAFQRDDGPSVMLLSLKAGGLGLTLTAADHVYIVDPWWNPAVEDQAGDRAHRIGQENPVIIHRLVARDTLEERILMLQARKRELLGAAVGEGGAVSLSRDEVLELIQ
jgi:SNF2 family DNA or RNA helicase